METYLIDSLIKHIRETCFIVFDILSCLDKWRSYETLVDKVEWNLMFFWVVKDL